MSGLALADASRPVSAVVVLAALSLLPFLALLTTSFVKISVVLAVLKSGLGAGQIPPSQIVTGLALLLTCVVMAPTAERMWRASGGAAVATKADPLSAEGVVTLARTADAAKEPLRVFLMRWASPRDRALFHGLALRARTAQERAGITDRDFLVLVPAFVASELKRAFEVGLLLFIPLLVVDLVIANLLLALGMHTVAPATVSLPFKLLLFVLADGWHLVLRGLVESYV